MILKAVKVGLLSLLSHTVLCAQDTTFLSVIDVISLAKKNSVKAKIASNNFRFGYWNYKNYKATLLPRLSVSGTLPNYFRSVNSIALPNGEYNFVYQEIANSYASLDLTQNIGLTGGRISMGSTLGRLDNFRGAGNQTSYSTAPYIFSYVQNSFFYNEFKWRKKAEPLKFEEAQRDFLERQEEICVDAVTKYFDFLDVQIQVELGKQNVESLDTLLRITEVRANKGIADLTAVLAAKLNLFNARKAYSRSVLQLELARQDFLTYLKLKETSNIELEIPRQIQVFTIDSNEAQAHARNNRKETIAFQRRILEAKQQVAKAKSESGPSFSLRADFGLTQTGAGFSETYTSRSLPRHSIGISFNIPILDWQINKSNRKRAELILDLEENSIEHDEAAFDQEILRHVMTWNMAMNEIQMVHESQAVAQQFYNLAKNRYALGLLSLIEFNNAQFEKDRAIMDHLANLRSYWTSYYEIRKLTLYDFIEGKPISKDYPVDD